MIRRFLAAIVLGSAACSAGAATCLKVSSGETMPLATPPTAAKLVLFGPDPRIGGAIGPLLDLATTSGSNPLQPGSAWRVTAQAAADIKARASAASSSDRAKFRAGFLNATGSEILAPDDVLLFFSDAALDDPGRAQACGASQATAPSGVPTPANSAVCASQLSTLNPPRYFSWVLFNSAGTICYSPFPLRQRDTLAFGLVLNPGEKRPDAVSVNVTGCTIPSQGPVVLSPGVPLSSLTLTSGTADGIRFEEVLPRVECASANPVMVVTITRDGKAGPPVNQTLSLIERVTATIHLGVLNSRLRESEFGLRTLNGQTTIVDKEAQGRGPEYVAMVVVQALPRYFESGLAYPGRDLLHDNEAKDRVGLVLALGLKDPGKRFGAGLSYELAKGLNVVFVREWLKRNRLNGVSEGDTFSGAASDIPTHREWSTGWAFGLSFDTAYIGQIFGAKK